MSLWFSDSCSLTHPGQILWLQRSLTVNPLKPVTPDNLKTHLFSSAPRPIIPVPDEDSILSFSWETQFPFEANSATSGSHTSSYLVCPFPCTVFALGYLNFLQLNYYSSALAKLLAPLLPWDTHSTIKGCLSRSPFPLPSPKGLVKRQRFSGWCNFLSWFLPLGQILVLESVPDINLLDYLPEILDGLFQILGDNGKEIRKM